MSKHAKQVLQIGEICAKNTLDGVLLEAIRKDQFSNVCLNRGKAPGFVQFHGLRKEVLKQGGTSVAGCASSQDVGCLEIRHGNRTIVACCNGIAP